MKKASDEGFDDFLKEKYDSGKALVTNTYSKTKDEFKEVSVSTLLNNDENFRNKLQKEFEAWKKEDGFSKDDSEINKLLRIRKSQSGDVLGLGTNTKGSLIVGIEHGEGLKSTQETIKAICKLPKKTKVVFLGEGGMTKDEEGFFEFAGEQKEIRDAMRKHFSALKEDSWDEKSNVYDNESPVFKHITEVLSLSNEESSAAIWALMVGQGEDLDPKDYLTSSGKAWLNKQALKGGASGFEGRVNWGRLTKKQKKEIYELCFRDDRSFKENQLFDAQETYNAFRQQELKEKINKYESEGLRVIAPVGNSHVELWSSEKKSSQNN